MAPPRTPDDKLRATVELVEQVYREGFQPGKPGTLAEAGKRGIASGLFTNRSMIWTYLDQAKERLGIEPDESLYRPRVYQHRPPGTLSHPRCRRWPSRLETDAPLPDHPGSR